MSNNTTMYEMCLLFHLTIGLRTINDITAACGFSEKLVAKDAITVELTQTVPFIPTDEIIEKYANIIKEKYNNHKEFSCEKCTFAGYAYIHPIAPNELKGENK